MHPTADYESLWPFSCFLSGINYYRLWKGPKFPMHIGGSTVPSSFFPFWLQLDVRWLEVRKTKGRKTNYKKAIVTKICAYCKVLSLSLFSCPHGWENYWKSGVQKEFNLPEQGLSVIFRLTIWIFMESEELEIKSKQASKRDRTSLMILNILELNNFEVKFIILFRFWTSNQRPKEEKGLGSPYQHAVIIYYISISSNLKKLEIT